MTATDATRPDPARLETFVDGVLDDVKGHHAALMGALGDHLGLFPALAQGPATSPELADRTGLQERYVREWLAGMTAAEYVAHDPSNDTFSLTPEQAAVLADDTSPVGLVGLFHEGFDDRFDVVTAFDVAHDLVDPDAVFRSIREALRPGGSFLLLDFKVADVLYQAKA